MPVQKEKSLNKIIKSSAILDLVSSYSKEENQSQFWNPYCQEMSIKSWLPMKSTSSSSNLFMQNLEQDSQYLGKMGIKDHPTEYMKTLSQSSCIPSLKTK